MFGLIIPAAVVSLGVINYFRRPKDYGVMTAERTSLYNAAISGALKDPNKLDKLAAEFDKQGLSEQAKLLRQRAALRRLPEDVQASRRAIYRQAMNSTNKAGILKLADVYDSQGCTGAALRLREKASGLPDVIPETAPEPTEAPETSDEHTHEAPPDTPEETETEPNNPDESVSGPTEVQT